jgi:large subunit ribosomal protein L5
MSILKEKQVSSFETLSKEFGIKNRLAAPRIQKVTINVGIGSAMKRDRNRKDFVIDRLSKITGQRPSVRGSKQSIASFKVRAGDPVGVAVTLRGTRMWSFLDKLVNVALPRTKDFRGITRSSAGDLGNMTIGIREHTIFPETSDEEISQVFGLAITIVTTATSRPEGLAFFEYLGFPLKKEDEKKAKRTRKRGK